MSSQTDEQVADQLFSKVYGNSGNGDVNTNSADDAVFDKQMSSNKMQSVLQQRLQGRQWNNPNPFAGGMSFMRQHPFLGTAVVPGRAIMNEASNFGQGVENSFARVADAMLPGQQAAPTVGTAPMQIGDVAASRGASEPMSQALGFAGSMAIPFNPARPVGEAMTAGAGNIGNSIRSAALQGAMQSAPMYGKTQAAMQHLADNPNIYSRNIADDIEEHGSELGNKIAAGIQSIGKMARGLYQKAYTNGNTTMVNPHIPIDINGTDLPTSLENRMASDSPEVTSAIGNTPLWKEPVNSNAMSMTHTYVPPRGTGIVDASGNELTLPSQHSVTGSVTSKEGPNVSKEMQHFVTDPTTGQQRIAAVRTINSTSDANPLRTVTVNDAIDRLKSGAPMTVSQLGALHKSLNGMGMATSSGMASDVSKVLAQHDSDFAKADSAWQSYSRLKGPAVAGNLFGGISETGNAGDQTGTKILKHFEYPQSTDAYSAPGVVDQEFSKYGMPANYTKQVKDLSSIDGLNDLGPHGHFAQSSLIPVAADVLGEHIPGAVGEMANHPVTMAVAGLGALGVNLMSSKGIMGGLVRGLSDKGYLAPGAASKLKSPAAQYLMRTMNPASWSAGAGMNAYSQNQQNQQQ